MAPTYQLMATMTMMKEGLQAQLNLRSSPHGDCKWKPLLSEEGDISSLPGDSRASGA